MWQSFSASPSALHTDYGSQNAFDNERYLRLATWVANRNDQLTEDFEFLGHVYTFKSHSHDDDLEHREDPPTSPTGAVADGIGNEEEKKKKFTIQCLAENSVFVTILRMSL